MIKTLIDSHFAAACARLRRAQAQHDQARQQNEVATAALLDAEDELAALLARLQCDGLATEEEQS